MTNLLILRTYIAGIPHRNPDLTPVTLGSALNLTADPLNEYDPTAIRVYHEEQFLGFVPREQTLVIHEAFERKAELSIVVAEKPMAKFKEIIFEVRATFPQEETTSSMSSEVVAP